MGIGGLGGGIGYIIREGAVRGVWPADLAHVVVLVLSSSVLPLVISRGLVRAICCAVCSASGRHRGPVGAGQSQQPGGSQQVGIRGRVSAA